MIYVVDEYRAINFDLKVSINGAFDTLLFRKTTIDYELSLFRYFAQGLFAIKLIARLQHFRVLRLH